MTSNADHGDDLSTGTTPLPNPTTVVAPAKLTLSLRMTGLRADGYHLIDAEMVTLDLHDTLEIDATGDQLALDTLQVIGGGPDVPTGPSNLVLRALDLTGRHAGIRLTKRIPSQAGLGGGSSDAGAVLRWADYTDLIAASRLGADIPFCTIGGRARVTGIGEEIEELPFLARDLTLVTPPIACATPAVFKAWDELGGPRNDDGVNDLEAAALVVAPDLARWRDQLGERAGKRPTLAGSGSTWFVEGHVPGDGHVTTKTTPKGWFPGSTDPS